VSPSQAETSEVPRRQSLQHGRLALALHALGDAAPRRDGATDGTRAEVELPLLLLHALGASAEAWRSAAPAWPAGPVFAFDFAGHGASERVRGGGYMPERFLADADVALAAVGDRAAVAGAGIGAYVALLLAGARPDHVPAALLLPGAGLAGAGPAPDSHTTALESPEAAAAARAAAVRTMAPGTDPWVWAADQEWRPDAYVADFAAAARCLLLATAACLPDDSPVPVTEAPAWWAVAASAEHARTLDGGLAEAFDALAAACR